jgi:hypothetical protein
VAVVAAAAVVMGVAGALAVVDVAGAVGVEAEVAILQR